jgi:hypothetical protein
MLLFVKVYPGGSSRDIDSGSVLCTKVALKSIVFRDEVEQALNAKRQPNPTPINNKKKERAFSLER